MENNIGEKGCILMSEALKVNSTLIKVNLMGNRRKRITIFNYIRSSYCLLTMITGLEKREKKR